jgi:hypothetical protein
VIKTKTEDQNWDQCNACVWNIQVQEFTCNYNICMYACIVIYFICTETSSVVSTWLIDCLKQSYDICLYLSPLLFCVAAFTASGSAPISTFPSNFQAKHAQIPLCLAWLTFGRMWLIYVPDTAWCIDHPQKPYSIMSSLTILWFPNIPFVTLFFSSPLTGFFSNHTI